MHGSSNLAQTLMRHELVDEFRILTYPVVLGEGKRLFADGARPAGLRLVDHEVTSKGVSVGVYTPTGPPPYGSFELDES